MGYPVITRLGINQFWYRHWYSLKSFQQNSKQDRLFISLLKLYINYGLSFNSFIFFNPYFFNKNFYNYTNNPTNINLKFFRRYYFSNEPLGIEHSYFLRYKTGEYFPIRLWLIRYSNWVILFFNCFRPVKSKSTSSLEKKKELHAINSGANYNSIFFKVKRFTLIYLFITKKLCLNLKYGF